MVMDWSSLSVPEWNIHECVQCRVVPLSGSIVDCLLNLKSSLQLILTCNGCQQCFLPDMMEVNNPLCVTWNYWWLLEEKEGKEVKSEPLQCTSTQPRREEKQEAKIWKSSRHSRVLHASCQEVSRSRTRGESKGCLHQLQIRLLILVYKNPKQTSPEVQKRGISGSTKRLMSSIYLKTRMHSK